MKITKQNYNDLRTKELDNNFAKVWHVNEIREELLANTPEGGGVKTIEGLEGDVVFQTNSTNITATINTEDNSINFNYTIPYYEIIGIINGADTQNPVTIDYVTDSEIAIEELFDFTTIDSPLYSGTQNAVRLRTTALSVSSANMQLTLLKPIANNPDYLEIPHIEAMTTSPFSIVVGALRNEGSADWADTTFGLKSGVMFTLKLFNVQILT
jgi:hypothetical protein